MKAEPIEPLHLGRLLGQRRAFSAVGGRCSAANAQLLRRLRDQKLFRIVSPSWRVFCTDYLGLNCRTADRVIALLNRFGPVYFELSELLGITPRQFLAIQPAVLGDKILLDGEALSLIPENAPRITIAILELLEHPLRRQPRPDDLPEPVHARIDALASRGRKIANQLLELYRAAHTGRERDHIVEVATEIRLILLQPEAE